MQKHCDCKGQGGGSVGKMPAGQAWGPDTLLKLGYSSIHLQLQHCEPETGRFLELTAQPAKPSQWTQGPERETLSQRGKKISWKTIKKDATLSASGIHVHAHTHTCTNTHDIYLTYIHSEYDLRLRILFLFVLILCAVSWTFNTIIRSCV